MTSFFDFVLKNVKHIGYNTKFGLQNEKKKG